MDRRRLHGDESGIQRMIFHLSLERVDSASPSICYNKRMEHRTPYFYTGQGAQIQISAP